MDKRLQKRHKRQVARAKENVKLSEPDLRTPEQIKAAREASQARSNDTAATGFHSSQAPRSGRPQSSGGAAKTDV